jgi:hypothetical protein
VVTEVGAHRPRPDPCSTRTGLFRTLVVDARTGKAEITAIVGRTRILGELLGQRFEFLALGQARLDLFDLGLGLRVGGLVVDFDQDVRRATLFGQVGDFFLIRRLQVFVLDADLVEEGTSSARCNR